MRFLIICNRNTNGLRNRRLVVEHFLQSNNMDVMLISKTHLTDKHNFKIRGFLHKLSTSNVRLLNMLETAHKVNICLIFSEALDILIYVYKFLELPLRCTFSNGTL